MSYLDFGARMYDSKIGRWLTQDPHSESYLSLSQYAYCGNNPINVIDPDGRDYTISFQRDKEGNVTGLTVKSKVYITGSNASSERAGELNKLAQSTFKSQIVDGVKVSFNISYEYSKDVSVKDLKAGENILDFNNKVTTADDRSHVTSMNEKLTGNKGEIYSDANNKTVMHETGHLVGLSDRYSDLDGGNLGVRKTYVHPGYQNNIMASSQNSILDKSQYGHYVYQFGNMPYVKTVNGRTMVDRNIKGNLMSPYEKGGLHILTGYEIRRK